MLIGEKVQHRRDLLLLAALCYAKAFPEEMQQAFKEHEASDFISLSRMLRRLRFFESAVELRFADESRILAWTIPMQLCKFICKKGEARVGLVQEQSIVLDLSGAGISEMHSLLEQEDPVAELRKLDATALPRFSLAEIKLRAP